ncbi:hypothetical protein JW756_04050 [Candidatus Woesearchaeota archaeon]|nr:hypothetical protein [Candidatus Woesearchaeota archaeon]
MSEKSSGLLALEKIAGFVIPYSEEKLISMKPDNLELISNYAARTKQLDAILSILTKEFCATQCDWNSDEKGMYCGCCEAKFYDTSMIDELLILQRLEARNNGWEKGFAKGSECDYFSEEGCKLRIFKSPTCIGYVCKRIFKPFTSTPEGKNLVDNFYYSMMDVFAGRIDVRRAQVLKSLDKAIAYGSKLVIMKNTSGFLT